MSYRKSFPPSSGATVVFVGLLAALFSGVVLLARETPAYYERDYETAEKLHKLYERLEDADTLFTIDSIDDVIVGGGCREEHLFYSEALEEVRKLAGRIRAGESLTYDEARYYEDQQQAEDRLWQEFEDCYTEQLRRPVFQNELPPGIDDYMKAVEIYAALQEEHQWQQDKGFDAVAAEIEREIDELESEPAYIATVTKVFRRVERQRKGGTWVQLQKGDRLMLHDIIRTGLRGRARIDLHDRIEEKNFGPTVVNIGHGSEVEMAEFRFLFEEEEEAGYGQQFLDFVRGTIRAFTKGFGGRAAFSVRVGTSLCGIRGTDIEIRYSPELGEEIYTLFSGAVEITTPNGKVNLKPGNRLTVLDGVPGPTAPISEPANEGPPT